jgi:hypothetical protein
VTTIALPKWHKLGYLGTTCDKMTNNRRE